MGMLDHWQPVCQSRSLRRRPISVKLAGHDIVVFRDGEGKVGALSDVCPHRRSEGMRCDQRLGQLPGGAEGGDRVGVTPARHFEAPASIVEMHPDGRFDVRS